MTTVSLVRSLRRIPADECFVETSPADCSGVVDVELEVQTTAAKQSSIASLLPSLNLEDALRFPSGEALELVKKRSSFVRLRTSYLSDTLRVSRPILDGATQQAVFVYVRT